VVHRTWNVLARIPKKRQAEVKKALHRIFYAASLDDAQDEASKFLARYGEEFPTATEVLGKHRSLCLTFYHFPERHWGNLGFDDGVWSIILPPLAGGN
jgi:transposase-like protein